MEKQKKISGRYSWKANRMIPVAFLLCLWLAIPLAGYGEEVSSPAVLQQGSVKVTGTVKDANGEPIIGANVIVVGSTTGVITDLDGNFSLDVPVGASFISVSSGIRTKRSWLKKVLVLI